MIDVQGVSTLRYSRIAVSTAITILQIKAGTDKGFQVLRAWCTQGGSAVSAQENICLIRKTAAATVNAASIGTNLYKHDPNGADPTVILSTSGTGFTASGEGTDGNDIYGSGFNTLIGFLYLPLPEERIYVPPSGIIALKFMNAPASKTWDAGITFKEE
jgi:hypothetical protein